MSSSLGKAALVDISIATPAGLGGTAHAPHVGVGQPLLKKFLIDLAIASALLWALLLYAIWDQIPQPTTFERMSYSSSP